MQNLSDEIALYLSELVKQLPVRDACEALGLSRNSHHTLKRLLKCYGIDMHKCRYEQEREEAKASGLNPDKVKHIGYAQSSEVNIERAVVFGDVHGLNVDERSFAVLLEVIEDIRPDRIFINGDFVDFFEISKFSSMALASDRVQSEVELAREMLDRIIDASNAKITYIEGNHEKRLEAFIRDKAPQLSFIKNEEGVYVLSMESILGLRRRGIEYVRSKTPSAYTKYGAITIGHFNKYSSVVGSVAKWFLEHRNESVIQGHTHKCAQLFRRFPDGREITCIEHGHISSIENDYVTDPDWCQGFVVITKRKDTDRFHVELVRIIDHECIYGGKLYSG